MSHVEQERLTTERIECLEMENKSSNGQEILKVIFL